MDMKKIKIEYMKDVTNGLLSKIVNVPNERGGYSGFQLFKKCVVDVDENGWFIEIDAHDDALPLMFEFKNKYFTYRLWNALQLKSSNQIRMYEILKQYEKIGYRIVSLEELRGLLGIEKNEYKVYKDFRRRVLDSCQQALEENTDIKFTYEPYGSKGPGGKVISLKFTIESNGKHKDPLLLEDFIGKYNLETIEEKSTDENDAISFLQEACCKSDTEESEFSRAEMEEILSALVKVPKSLLPENPMTDKIDIRRFDYLKEKYIRMNRISEKEEIKSKVSYIIAMIKKDFEKEENC
jgi:initiator repB protein